jgi:hypothetical protein
LLTSEIRKSAQILEIRPSARTIAFGGDMPLFVDEMGAPAALGSDGTRRARAISGQPKPVPAPGP